MAGGPHAEHIVCLECAEAGLVTRADRVYEGVESDRYCCLQGHEFGLDWRRGEASEPQWPPPAELAAAIEAIRGAQ